jgi:uncharacterized protein
MITREIIYLVITGVAAGILAGTFGLGGGLIVTPFLVLILGYSQQTANGTSLVALLGPVGIFGVMAYYNAGKITGVHIRAGLIIALGMLAGTYFGSKLALALPETIVRRAFAVFLVIMAFKMWTAGKP